jgi:hypothetical protein
MQVSDRLFVVSTTLFAVQNYQIFLISGIFVENIWQDYISCRSGICMPLPTGGQDSVQGLNNGVEKNAFSADIQRFNIR